MGPVGPHCYELIAAWSTATSPVLKLRIGPPTADFGSAWSPQKSRKFQQIQPMTKVQTNSPLS